MNKKDIDIDIIESYINIVMDIEIRFQNYLTIKNYHNQKNLNEMEKIKIHSVVNSYKYFFNDYCSLNQDNIFLEISKFFDNGNDSRTLSLMSIDEKGSIELYKKHKDTIDKINKFRNTNIAHNDKDKSFINTIILDLKELILDLKEFFRKSHVLVRKSDVVFVMGIENNELLNIIKVLHESLNERKRKKWKEDYYKNIE